MKFPPRADILVYFPAEFMLYAPSFIRERIVLVSVPALFVFDSPEYSHNRHSQLFFKNAHSTRDARKLATRSSYLSLSLSPPKDLAGRGKE